MLIQTNFSEYLLLSNRPDEKPSLRLPDRMPDKPRLTLPGSPDEKLRYAAPGEPFALICDVPPGSKPVRWFKDGRSYSAPRPGVLVDNMEGLIRFNQLMMEDSGVYTCVAENGDHFYSTRLDVNPNHTKGLSVCLSVCLFVSLSNNSFYIYLSNVLPIYLILLQ